MRRSVPTSKSVSAGPEVPTSKAFYAYAYARTHIYIYLSGPRDRAFRIGEAEL
jgi:hypothetical protein